MKQISAVLVMGFSLLFTVFSAVAQTQSIEPHPLTIAYSKTTNVIFPYAIVSVDRGSRDVLAQKASGVENILQVKAAKENFQQTNLTVVTADGKLTSFVVDYAEQPAALNISMDATNEDPVIAIPSESVNMEEMREFARASVASKKKLRGEKNKTFGIRLRLNGIYIHEDVMCLRIRILNSTNINYDIDQLRLYIRDQKKVKRTASQEIEISPVLVYNDTPKVSGNADNTFAFVVPKFTIPDKKFLVIQLIEKNGGRHLELHVKNKKIVKAAMID